MKRIAPAVFATVFVLICAITAYRIIRSGRAPREEEEHHEKPARKHLETFTVGWSTVSGKPEQEASSRLLLTLPASAVFSRKSRTYVYRVEAERAREHSVEIGRQLGDRVEVRGGLNAGDVVLKDGSLSLAPDTPVESK